MVFRHKGSLHPHVSGDDGDFETILTKMGIAQSMLMLPVCIHSNTAWTLDEAGSIRGINKPKQASYYMGLGKL